MNCEVIMYVNQQKGMILVISLLMLLVLTLLGLSTLNSSTLEGKMAANLQSQTTAFQAAETAIDNAVRDNEMRISAMDSDQTETYPLVDGVTSTATVKYLGTGIPYGFSLKAGGGGFLAHEFDTQGLGTADNLAAQATHTLGVAQIGPGG
jgi:type IV pilus assembly protein PilX